MADVSVVPELGAPAAQREGEQAEMPPASANRFTQAALERHKREGIWLAVRARWAVLVVIAILLIVLNPSPMMLFYYPFLLALGIIGWLQTRVGTVGHSRRELLLLFCDVAVFVCALVVPNPLSHFDWPTAMQYRFENFIYLFLLLALATLSYSWRTIVAVGNWTCAMWLLWLIGLWYSAEEWPELQAAAQAAFGSDPDMLEILDPTSYRFDMHLQYIVVYLMVAFTLALSVRRFNKLLLNNAELERERENLSRYFSPNVVDELSQNDEPLKQIRNHDVAVVFVDIKGFTRFAADRSAEAVIETLRQFHGRMETAVFGYGGTLDKYLGDGLMATFGTPLPAENDAERAYLCARAMIEQGEAWNRERGARGEPPLIVSVGVHFGPVVLGDIGANRLEYAVIGNTVNIASRIEGLTRLFEVPLLISDALHARLPAVLTEDLSEHPGQPIAGLDAPMTVWSYSPDGSPPEDLPRAPG